MGQLTEAYSGFEPSAALPRTTGVEDDSVFAIWPEQVSERAEEIFDETVGAVVGFRVSHGGVSHFFDLDGRIVWMEETPLGSPFLGPEILFVAGAFVRTFSRAAISQGLRRLPSAPTRQLASRFAATVSGPLRSSYVRLTTDARRLRFTETTMRHMQQRGRHVPLHVLAAGIRNGRRLPDPQRARGASMYVSTMMRNGQRYTLEIVLRDSDRTILHFVYRTLR